jgi:hypothetical protein
VKTTWLDDYLAAWRLHPQAGGPAGQSELAGFLARLADDVVYEDVPTGIFAGHEGVQAMCEGAYSMSSDMSFEIIDPFFDGRRFAFESVGHGTNDGAIGPIPATGRVFELRAVAIGTVNADGLVQVHRDFWDLAGFLGQLGLTGG